MKSMRRAYTLIELLIVVTVIVLILSLTLPAIQFAREASRRANCISNLKNLGIAIHNYESSHRYLPYLSGPFDHSMFISLLPHLEQQSLYENFRFDWNGPGAIEANDRVREVALPLLMCPSNGSLVARTDYLVNQGTRLLHPMNGPFAIVSGKVIDKTPLRLADAISGSSNVAAISETRLHDQGPNHQPTDTLVRREIESDEDAVQYIRECNDRSKPRETMRRPQIHGFQWDRGRQTSYLHLFVPNHWDCENGSRPPDGIHCANSSHASGVNLLFLDGHVAFVSSNIDQVDWSKMGGR